MKKLILISGGGTGGHVFPALAVAEQLKLMGHDNVCWIGSRKGIEKSIVKRWGIPFVHVPSGKLRRYLSLENLSDLFRVAAGLMRSIAVLRKLRPAVVFSKGGFVTVPPVLAARLLGIPVVSHESDFDPGLATKINAWSSTRICIPYQATARYFKPRLRRRLVVTGNPVRAEIARGDAQSGCRLLGFDPARPILFVQGGSLGARQLNELLFECLPTLPAAWQVVHQSGKAARVHPDQPGRYRSFEFLSEDYTHVLAASTLVLSRAGAGSLWEMGTVKKPAILLPLDSGSRGDQLRNARFCEQAGCCRVLPQDGTAQAFLAAMQELSHNSATLQHMAQAWDSFMIRDADLRIATVVAGVLEAGK